MGLKCSVRQINAESSASPLNGAHLCLKEQLEKREEIPYKHFVILTIWQASRELQGVAVRIYWDNI